jgi:K+-transporting ATPase KdpF subunit
MCDSAASWHLSGGCMELPFYALAAALLIYLVAALLRPQDFS